MSQDVKLLPLPEHMKAWACSLADDAQAYALANMEPLLRERDALRNRLEDTVRDLTDAKAEIEALRAEVEESYAVVEKLAKLLAETAIVIKGPEPDMTKWSYHDIPDGVRAIQARAERLAEALRSLLGRVDDLTSYAAEDDEIGHRPCCHVLSYKEHTDDCAITQARAALALEGGNG